MQIYWPCKEDEWWLWLKVSSAFALMCLLCIIKSCDRIFYRYAAGEPASLNCSQYEVMVVCEGRTWWTITCWRQAPNMNSNPESFFYTFLCCKSIMQKPQAPSIGVIDNKSVKWILDVPDCVWTWELSVQQCTRRWGPLTRSQSWSTGWTLAREPAPEEQKGKRWFHEAHGNAEIRNK